jgi:hypothetical protein
MYIHKYIVNGQSLYLVSEKASRPSKNVTLTGQDWKGYSSGSSVGNAISFLSDLSFNKEEKKEPKEKTKKVVSEVIRKFATMIDKE